MKQDIPRYGDVIVEEGKATLEYHVFLEDLANSTTGAIEVQDETTPVTVALDTLNFVGSGVVASEGAPGIITVTIGGGGTTTWGDVVGTLADQTDLQAALDAKAVSGHVHSTNNITSGTFIDARIAQSNITQHEAALSIGIDQLTAAASTGDTLIYDGANWVVDMTELIKDVEFEGDDIYVAEAVANTATSAASWRISKTSFVGDDSTKRYADGDTNFDNIKDNYLSLSYS